MPVVDEVVEHRTGQAQGESHRAVMSSQLSRSPAFGADDRRIAIALALLSFGYLCLFRRFTQLEPDEGIVLQGAQRILMGQIPYRDFFTFLTPGSYFLMALIFRVFGNSMLVARTTLAVIGAIFSVITYALARRVCSKKSALLAAALVALTALPYRFLVLHNWDSTFWACLAVYSAIRLSEIPRGSWAFATGTLCSLAVLFEQSKGAGLSIGIVLGFILISLSGRHATLPLRSIAWAAFGFACPLAITFIYFAYHHAAGIMLVDWLWPLRHYSAANHVFYGSQNWSDEIRRELFDNVHLAVRGFTLFVLSPLFMIPAVPLLAVAGLIYWTVQLRKGSAALARARYYVLYTAIISGLLFSIVIGRADILHFVYLQPLFMVVLAWIIDGRDVPGALFRKIKPLTVVVVAGAFLLFSAPLLLRALTARVKIDTRRGVITSLEKDTVIGNTQAHVPTGSTTLVYPYLPLYYYLTATTAPGSYDYFQPGMHTAEQADQFLSQIDSAQIPVVLFESSFAQKIPTSWPGTSMKAIAHDPIADYILARYRSCKVLQSPEQWTFLYMVRKDLPCP
jgi:hypothetical protein